MKQILFVVIFFAPSVFADEEMRSALTKTQDEMRQADFAKKSSMDSPAAKKTYDSIQQLGGNSDQNTRDIYGLAADVLGNMKDQSPEAMQKMMDEAQKDPSAFAAKWTPEQKQKLSDLSSRMPAAQKEKP